MQKNLAVLKDMINGLDILVKDRFQVASSVDTKEFKSSIGWNGSLGC